MADYFIQTFVTAVIYGAGFALGAVPVLLALKPFPRGRR